VRHHLAQKRAARKKCVVGLCVSEYRWGGRQPVCPVLVITGWETQSTGTYFERDRPPGGAATLVRDRKVPFVSHLGNPNFSARPGDGTPPLLSRRVDRPARRLEALAGTGPTGGHGIQRTKTLPASKKSRGQGSKVSSPLVRRYIFLHNGKAPGFERHAAIAWDRSPRKQVVSRRKAVRHG
jgi:hypothetical protein